jgi:HK97 family phage major capsid protein
VAVSIAEQIGKINLSMETRGRAGEFCKYAQVLLASHGRLTEAAVRAEKANATPRVIEILEKAASAATTTGAATSALVSYRQIAAGFVASLAGFSAFDSIAQAGGFTAMPTLTRVVIVATAAAASSTVEATAKPVTQIAVDGLQLEPRKASAIVVASRELAQLVTSAATTLIGDELRKAIGLATDVEFVGGIIGSHSQSIASTGNFAADLESALAPLTLGATSRVFIIAPPAIVRSIALMRGTGGAPTFPDVGINGGVIAGMSLFASDALSNDAVVLDATAIAADTSMPIVLDASREANIDLSGDDVPALSLFQKNLQGLRAERPFAFHVLRDNAICAISGVTA